MPRLLPPAYVHHKPSGQARVRIDGRDRYLGPYGSQKSRDAYARIVDEWRQEHEQTPHTLTVGQLSLVYVRHCETHYRKHGEPTSELQVVRDTLKRLNRLYRKRPAVQLSPKALKAVRQSMIDAGLARTTINGAVARIRRMYRWAVSEELVPPAVLLGLEAVRDLQPGRSDAREPEDVRPVPDAFVDAVRPHVPAVVWAMIQFQRLTGARPGETRILRMVDVITSGPVWEYRPSTHKTEHHEKDRVVMIGQRAQAVLREFMSTDLQAFVFSPDGSAGARPYDRASYRNAIIRGCETAFEMPDELRDIRKTLKKVASHDDSPPPSAKELRRLAREWRQEHCWTPNQLRHNFGTEARRQAGLEAARVALGHTSTKTTEIYAERDVEAARAIAARIG